MNPVQAEEFRWKVKEVLEKERIPRKNINTGEQKALKTLQMDSTIKILPADKGNATVIMDTQTYDDKLEAVLETGNYKLLQKDPTSSIERKIYSTLTKYKTFIPDKERTHLTPHYSKPPHLYGLPKIHKPDMPLRPITSSRNSPTYNLAKYLLPILQPLQGTSSSFVKNSKHFVDIIKDVELGPEDRFISFDVESLYTNVPIEESLNIIKRKLEEDIQLHERTGLPVKAILELLQCCLHNSYFQEKSRFFSQVDGLPMGSSLSPVIANIYMEWFEELAIREAKYKPKLWLRYVDDTFIIWNHGDEHLGEFFARINNMRDSIKFTMEKETNSTLSFLDVKAERTDTGILTSVYRKKTHTGQYLNYGSNHPNSTKRGIVRTLVERAMSICNNQESLEAEINHIKKDLRRNGYSEKLIGEVRKQLEKTKTTEERPQNPVLILPYIRGISEKIRRIGNKYNIKSCFQSGSTLRSFLTKTKPENTTESSKNCIYKVPCECGDSYIGETKRPLSVRIAEHKKWTQRGETSKSGIADHAWTKHHRILWDEASVLHREEHWFKRKFIETTYIEANSAFSQPSVEIKNVWKPLMDRFGGRKSAKPRAPQDRA